LAELDGAVGVEAPTAPPRSGWAARIGRVRPGWPGRSERSGWSGRSGRGRNGAGALTALLWLGPALLLIGGVVLFPAVKLIQASLGRYSITGLRTGDAGSRNYTAVLQHESLPTVLLNTVIWVVAVVGLTIVISFAVAQFLTKEFHGRRFVRLALIVPWASSLLITSQLFVLIYDYNYGLLNHALVGLGLIDTPIDFLGDDRWTLASMIVVGVFVSVPFTVYVFVAGLNAIPDDVHEAARVDGASPWQSWSRITLPLMRPAVLVATVLNTIYVFNSFPIVYTLNDRNPGFGHDTTITFMYKLAFKSQEKDVGMSAAAGILNVLMILVVVAIYLKVTSWREQEES
jgi:multiple sugar transport system permease protein